MIFWALFVGLVAGFPRKGPRRDEDVGNNKWIQVGELKRYVFNSILFVFDEIFMGFKLLIDTFGLVHFCLLTIILIYFFKRSKNTAKNPKKIENMQLDLKEIEDIYSTFTFNPTTTSETEVSTLRSSTESLKNSLLDFQTFIFSLHISLWALISEI